MESIEKLRELAADINASEIVDHMKLYPSCVFDGAWLDAWHDEFNRVIDRLESEIAERYMLLPVDADGVPIHVGDELCGYGRPKGGVQVAMVSESCVIVREDWNDNPAKHGLLWAADEVRHVKQRTVEDVLREFGDWYVHVKGGCDEPGVIADYAAELRDLMGVDR